jgi:peptidoglycan/LPS O-acetylase OafA/YrhL
VKLTQGGSLLLDCVRFAAAMMVFASHFVTFLPLGLMVAAGHQAVWIFFVLSGFVIRFITVSRPGTLTDYSIDRISRLYSVVGPALLFTFGLTLLGHLLHLPGDYLGPLPQALLEMLKEFAANMTALAQCWGYDVLPATNTPLWSLSFEAIYYAMYAFAFYRVRGRWFWIALLLLVAGPAIALLSTVWLLGCWICDLYLKLRLRRDGLRVGLLCWGGFVVMMAVLRHPLGRLMTATDVDHRTAWTKGLHVPASLLRDGSLPWLSRFSVGGIVVGLATGFTILAGLLIMDRLLPEMPPKLTKGVRIVADSTFTLYLFHLPLLILVERISMDFVYHHRGQVVLLISIPLLLIPVGRWLDHLKLVLRRRLQGWLPDAKKHTAA